MEPRITPIWIKFWTVWAICLVLVLLAFIVAEGWALKRAGFGDTLTETVVYLRDTNSWLYWVILDSVYAMAGVSVWLMWHFRFWER